MAVSRYADANGGSGSIQSADAAAATVSKNDTASRRQARAKPRTGHVAKPSDTWSRVVTDKVPSILFEAARMNNDVKRTVAHLQDAADLRHMQDTIDKLQHRVDSSIRKIGGRLNRDRHLLFVPDAQLAM